MYTHVNKDMPEGGNGKNTLPVFMTIVKTLRCDVGFIGSVSHPKLINSVAPIQ